MDNYKTKSVGEKMKKTRLSKLKQYINKNKLDITNREELKEQIKKIFKKKKRIYPSNEANRFRETHSIEKGNKIMRTGLEMDKRVGADFTTLCRVNGVLNSHTLIRRKMIDQIYYENCLLCNKGLNDNITHWATECENTTEIREIWLPDMTIFLKEMHKDDWKKILNKLFAKRCK